MLGDNDRPNRPGVDAPSVWVDVNNWDGPRAALLLETAGGRRVPGGPSALVYQFPTVAARDDALDLVRRRFGWTIATPIDDGP